MDATDPEYRLHALYRSLIAWGYIITNDKKTLRNLSISPSQQRFLSDLRLDRMRVFNSIKLLSAWKNGRMDTFICALRVSSVWS